MSSASNRKYLRDLVMDHLMPIPSKIALEAGIKLLMRMVHATAVDSGQAAANWHLIPYTGSPSKPKQRMYWGYNDRQPSFPGVGWKSWLNADQPRGNIEIISYVLYERAESTIVSRSRRVSGVMVFNPITPGFQGFRPGSDLNYERNALERAYVDADAAARLSVAEGARKVAQKFRALRVIL